MRNQARLTTIVLLMLMLAITSACNRYEYPFQNPDLSIEERVDNIISLMTLEEKIACLGSSTEVPRLGIPNAGRSEGIHGVVQRNITGGASRREPIPTTQFPQAVGMGETWNPELIRQAGRVQATEARYITQSEKYSRPMLVLWGPNADLARDPRWGRIDESYGEDAYFAGTMSVAFIKGLQGDDPKYWLSASLLKHLLANSNERGRYGSSSDFDERLMREYYSVPFRMGFVEGGAKSYMAAYNAWNGTPMTVHPMLKDIVAKEWGVDGIVSTDAGSVRNMVSKHKTYASQAESAAATIKAGSNQFLDEYKEAVPEALKENLLTEKDINEVMRGKFRVVIRLGLLDPQSTVPYSEIGSGEEPWNTEEHKAVARQVARESVVLLKNAGDLLPLDKQALKSVAVIGPRAEKVLPDLYGGQPPYAISPLQGIKDKVGSSVTVNFTAGEDSSAAAEMARSSDVAVVVVGNHPTCSKENPVADFRQDDASCEVPSEGMENSDRTALDLQQEGLIRAVHRANPKTVVVLFSSFPYAINWTQQNVPSILHMSHSAQEMGTAIADVLFGDYNPAGRLVHTWPKSLDQLPPMMDYNLRNGRTYMYFKGQPLYPFGYGLSYTTFEYSNLRTNAENVASGGELAVSVDVTNKGSRGGDEVVQLYVKHERSKVARPLKELRGFERVSLKPNETKTVQMSLKAESLAYWDEQQSSFVVEGGTLRIMVGGSAADVKLERTIGVVPRAD